VRFGYNREKEKNKGLLLWLTHTQYYLYLHVVYFRAYTNIREQLNNFRSCHSGDILLLMSTSIALTPFLCTIVVYLLTEWKHLCSKGLVMEATGGKPSHPSPHTPQLLLGDPEMFSGQKESIIPAVNSGSLEQCCCKPQLSSLCTTTDCCNWPHYFW